MSTIKVLVNNQGANGRIAIDVELVRRTPKTLWVRLPDGHIITRKVSRDLVTAEALVKGDK
uniref:Uncharacterized protein n=1 Tax=viral metagenome TaxID=1070528 RepID=A0A6M3LMV8_9ZZZZ